MKGNRAEYIVSKYRYGLTEEQQDFIRANFYNITDLLKLTQACFDNPSLTENTSEFKNVRRFALRVKKKHTAFNFSDEQIDFILGNCSSSNAVEICKKLFPNKTSVVVESQTAAEIIKANNLHFEKKLDPIELDSSYTPPRTEQELITMINLADTKANFKLTDLSDSRKKDCIRNLKRTMHSPRFIATASSYRDIKLRNLFESQFIRYTYDKPDLTSEEADQFMSLCNEHAVSVMLTEQLADLNAQLKTALVDSANNRDYNKNISDSRAKVASEYHECQGRINKLVEQLFTKRSARLKLEGEANESLAKWVDLVVREDGRKKLLRLQEANNLKLREEIRRIDNFERLICEFAGMGVEEILKF